MLGGGWQRAAARQALEGSLSIDSGPWVSAGSQQNMLAGWLQKF